MNNEEAEAPSEFIPSYTSEEINFLQMIFYLKATHLTWMTVSAICTLALLAALILDDTSCDVLIFFWGKVQIGIQVTIIILRFVSLQNLKSIGNYSSPEDIDNFAASNRFQLLSASNRFLALLWIIWFTVGSMWVIQSILSPKCELGLLLATIVIIVSVQLIIMMFLVILLMISSLFVLYRFFLLMFTETESENSTNESPEDSEIDLDQYTSKENFHFGLISDDNNSCAICLEDYAEGVELKFLPCSELHHFHSDCVDKWLSTNKSCPLCKRAIDQPPV